MILNWGSLVGLDDPEFSGDIKIWITGSNAISIEPEYPKEAGPWNM